MSVVSPLHNDEEDDTLAFLRPLAPTNPRYLLPLVVQTLRSAIIYDYSIIRKAYNLTTMNILSVEDLCVVVCYVCRSLAIRRYYRVLRTEYIQE